jgi:hypothetical protein
MGGNRKGMHREFSVFNNFAGTNRESESPAFRRLADWLTCRLAVFGNVGSATIMGASLSAPRFSARRVGNHNRMQKIR